MKRRIHHAIIKDMQKYIEGFNSEEYIAWNGETDKFIIEQLKKYYSNHLPIDIVAWKRIYVSEEKFDSNYERKLSEQIRFVKDRICELLFETYEEYQESQPMVIATYILETILLPIYQINLKCGVEIVLGCNFYSWKVSINSKEPIEFNFMDLIKPEKIIPQFLCEGFPKEKIYGSYEQNNKKFTVEFISEYDLYTYLFLLKKFLKAKKEHQF